MQGHGQGWQVLVLTRGVWSVEETSAPLRSHVRRCAPNCPWRPWSYPFGAVAVIPLVPETHLLERSAGLSPFWLVIPSRKTEKAENGWSGKNLREAWEGRCWSCLKVVAVIREIQR